VKIAGIRFGKMDLFLLAGWTFVLFYELFLGNWLSALLALCFIVMLLVMTIQADTILSQKALIIVLLAELGISRSGTFPKEEDK
jgi:hypothetical protein